ncbi:MAG: membrane protein insertion efficiency factor YidD [bacterium]
MKYNLIFIIIFFPLLGYCQEWKSFKIQGNEDKFYDSLFYNKQNRKKNIINKIILNYQINTVPIQNRKCPCIPSCSNYTQKCIHKYGLLAGIIRGTERLFIRENPTMKNGSYYYEFMWDNSTRKNIYDPVEANNIFKQKDWRIIDPLFINEFYGNSPRAKFGD